MDAATKINPVAKTNDFLISSPDPETVQLNFYATDCYLNRKVTALKTWILHPFQKNSVFELLFELEAYSEVVTGVYTWQA